MLPRLTVALASGAPQAPTGTELASSNLSKCLASKMFAEWMEKGCYFCSLCAHFKGPTGTWGDRAHVLAHCLQPCSNIKGGGDQDQRLVQE